MANSIKYTSIFEKYYKRYAKKFNTLPKKMLALEQMLIENPTSGTDLGNRLFKIR
jgi:hypothetical protein